MMIAIFPVLVLLAGLLIWFLSSKPKVSEAGKILFFCGVLVLTWVLASHAVRVG